MKSKRKILQLSLLLCCLQVFAPAACAPKTTIWRIEQKQYWTGNHLLYLTPSAIKIVNTTGGYELLSKAPEWRLLAYRPDDKIIFDVTRAGFYRAQEFTPGLVSQFFRPPNKIGTQSLNGVKLDVLRAKEAEFWVAHLPNIPQSANDLLSAYYRLRPVEGLLVKVTREAENDKNANASFLSAQYKGRLTVVETLRIKQIPYDATLFADPKGYRKAKAVEDIMTSSARRNNADAIIEELGLGENLGAKKSK